MSATPIYNYQPTADEALTSGNFNVTTAGVAEAMTSTARILDVILQAKITNNGNIYVGGSNVSSSNGIGLAPGQSISLSVTNLSKIYLDADASGDGVKWTATKE